MAWVEPIFDRTQADIDAKAPKGRCNYTDLNRLEGNCEVLSGLLGLGLVTKTWNRTDLPNGGDFLRIRNMVAAIRSTGYIYGSTPQTPAAPLNTWGKWNDAERILFDARDSFSRTMASFYFTGELYAADNIGVM